MFFCIDTTEYGGDIIKEQLSLFSFLEKPKQVTDMAIPEGITLKRGQKWCPYCSTKVIFQKDKDLGIKRCPICGISERDYWVKKVNHD